MDEGKLHQLVGKFLQDLGGAFSVPLVQIGERLGLYQAMVEHGPCSSQQFAEHTGFSSRYLHEWLCAQAASGYMDFDAESSTFSMNAEQQMLLANPDSPFYMAPAFGAAAAIARNEPLVREAFQSGKGIAWQDQTECLSCAVARFFRPGYQNHLVQAWLPALDGMADRLRAGAEVADVGCGHGITTTLMASTFPSSRFTGFDFHAESVAAARKHASSHDVPNAAFEVSLAKELPGKYDLITMFDCLHDMGDPVGGMERIRESLKQDGLCMIVEPMAGNSIADNLNPVGRMYYSASTMVCVPTSLAQETGAALGAQAGENRLREVAEKAGFRNFRRVAETPFNLVLEASA